HFKSLGLGVSFYTTGHPTSKLRELIELPHRGVTISLHSVKEDKRKRLIPSAGSLEELINTLREALNKLSARKRKSISLAYLLLEGVNDSEDEIKSFAQLVKELGVSATLLRYNRTVEDYKDVDDSRYERFFLLLRTYGIRVTLSTRFRRDRLGGCGTLAVNRTLTEC
ncbi:MAG: radical SAM protein, partial [Aquificaceae bacterium]|nr:radical SAM protein [Aquificaceae bacterium]